MTEVTVKQLAEMVGIPIVRLEEQLREAGIQVAGADSLISESEKMQLLGYLRRSHGKEAVDDAGTPSRITLKRKIKTELKQPAATALRQPNVGVRAPVVAKGSKTVSVEVRRKRTYIKRGDVPEETARVEEAEQARRALEEQAELRRRSEEEERSRREAEEVRRRQEEERRHLDEQRRQEELHPKLELPQEPEPAPLEISIVAPAAELESTEQQVETLEVEAVVEPVVERVEKVESDADSKHRKAARKQSPTDAKEAEAKGPAVRHKQAAHRAPKKLRGASFGEDTVDALDDLSGSLRFKKNKGIEQKHGFSKPTAPVIREVEVPSTITVGELAQRMTVKAAQVIKTLMKMGIMATINQSLERDEAVLVVEEMGHTVVQPRVEDIEAKIMGRFDAVDPANLEPRAPIVTIMGHVDHGKTSLLDYIRRSRVAAGEAGGITQHIGAYHVETGRGMVSFLDTPGHAAFSAMRARGAQLTDVVVLVVAADDGVMPQTVEAIQHAKSAGVPIVVAVNKIDKADANPDRVMQELSQHGVISEAWGGDTQFAHVSAKSGVGIDQLLESIILQAELLELKAARTGPARGTIIESSLEKGRGPVATVMVQSGLLERGDVLVSGTEVGKVRAMFDENGKPVKHAGPSIPVQVLGFSGAPNAGDPVLVAQDEKSARELAAQRKLAERDSRLAEHRVPNLANLFANMDKGEAKTVNLIIKADVQGSVEALRDALIKAGNEEVSVVVVSAAVGGITESDVNLAITSNSIVIGFNVRAEASARRLVDEKGIDMRYYSIIYEVIDDVKKAILGMLSPVIREEIIGLALVRDVFRSSKFGAIAGCMVVEGVIRRNNPIRVLRNNVVIYEGVLESLRRFKDDVSDVRSGTECGIGVKNYNDVQPGDHIEVFERTVIEREL